MKPISEINVLVLMPPGFEELEFVSVVDILRRANITVTTAGLGDKLINGSHNIKMVADIDFGEVRPENFDAIVLPGGYPGFVNLCNDSRVIDLVLDMDKSNKIIAVICGASTVLVKAGILEGRKLTVNPAGINQLKKDQYVDERVVIDRNLITSQAAGTALEFALVLVEVMAGKAIKDKIAKEILANM